MEWVLTSILTLTHSQDSSASCSSGVYLRLFPPVVLYLLYNEYIHNMPECTELPVEPAASS